MWIFDWFLLSEEGILRDTERIEDGIRTADSPLIVTNASNIARRANRVLQVAEMEAQNSEDPLFVDRVNEAAENLKSSQYYKIYAYFCRGVFFQFKMCWFKKKKCCLPLWQSVRCLCLFNVSLHVFVHVFQ